ncbi:MAG: hypothetical protein COU90_03590 [Candidatus Ryanbacteria bacterium CG10_big_fil_rev_8_21_14_0_10_43_42]|uniref:Phospholipid/glycerol acyltransferase domain-containing protein n=1 Tax=Candidatus Ryanbacteria bacterium CG10_big_fil_rev_8_21_14_0_10_43_42 TaxID=1974864 RepID=A0A2M8KWM1_9BACT|nr:MAG: hypothetical protein COU90_03590 [Candidatus Ryanbacteria bacterium CG10_big_fil_rev_8_21_14_0_10_43_42]
MYLQTILRYIITRRLRRQNRIPQVVHPERLKRLTGGPLLIVANHIRAMDPFYIGAILPFSLFPLRFLIARWFHTPMLMFFAATGIIPLLANIGALITVQKGKGVEENSRKPVEKLRAGKVVGIFPEGKRNPVNGELGHLKFGAAAIAYKSHAPVLPLFITFPDKTIERATITVGEIFYVETSDYEEGTALIRKKLLELAPQTK